MSDERQKQLEREREENQKKLEERLKALENQNKDLEASKARILEESQKYKAKSKEFETQKELEAEEKRKLEERTLLEKGEYKKLLEQRELELEEERKKASDEKSRADKINDTLTDARKLSAFENRLGGKLKSPSYLTFVDTSKILIDPDSGKVDSNSVDSVVKGFLSEHKALVDMGGGRMPNGQGGFGGTHVSLKDYKSGSLKEMKEKLASAHQSYVNKKK